MPALGEIPSPGPPGGAMISLMFAEQATNQTEARTLRAGGGHPPLQRRPDEGLFGGVCAGLAVRLDVNVPVVRIFAAALAGVGGAGLGI